MPVSTTVPLGAEIGAPTFWEILQKGMAQHGRAGKPSLPTEAGDFSSMKGQQTMARRILRSAADALRNKAAAQALIARAAPSAARLSAGAVGLPLAAGAATLLGFPRSAPVDELAQLAEWRATQEGGTGGLPPDLPPKEMARATGVEMGTPTINPQVVVGEPFIPPMEVPGLAFEVPRPVSEEEALFAALGMPAQLGVPEAKAREIVEKKGKKRKGAKQRVSSEQMEQAVQQRVDEIFNQEVLNTLLVPRPSR